MFRVILKWLAENEAWTVRRNLKNITEYGRFDDLLVLFDTEAEGDMLRHIKRLVKKDIKAMERGAAVSLLGKWLPSVNTSNETTVEKGKRIARFLGMSEKQYRKTLVQLREHIKVIENNLRERDYTFDYSKQPSKAMLKYRKEFMRNDYERYVEFLEQVRSGESEIHTGTLFPYEIISPIMKRRVTEDERRVLDATWSALPDWCLTENAIAVIDGSGSMYCTRNGQQAINVALSMGIYFAERSKGALKNHFITFSAKPQLVEIKGEDIFEKVKYCQSYDEISNTNIEKVFELLLATAVKNRVTQDEMPDRLYIISDMEFDRCAADADAVNFEYAKCIFEAAGYKLPQVIFWNVASRKRQQPVTKNEQGVILVSGCTSKIFDMVSGGCLSEMTPYSFMMEVLESERYRRISA